LAARQHARTRPIPLQDVSVDGQLCGTIGKAATVNTINCSNKLGRSVKLQLRGTNFLTLCEVEVWGSNRATNSPQGAAATSAPGPPLSRPPRAQGTRPGNPQQASNPTSSALDGRWSPAAAVAITIAVILALAGTSYFARRVYIARRVRQLQGQEMASGGLRGPIVVGQVVLPSEIPGRAA